MISFLFCERYFFPVVNKNINTEETTFNRKVFELIIDASSKYRWNCWITKSVEQKIRSSNTLTGTQVDALMNLIKAETSTHGVKNLEGIHPTSESAKNLSFQGNRVIVLVNKADHKEEIHSNPRIISLTPREFLNKFNELQEAKSEILELTDNKDDYLLNSTLMVKKFFNGK